MQGVTYNKAILTGLIVTMVPYLHDIAVGFGLPPEVVSPAMGLISAVAVYFARNAVSTDMTTSTPNR